MEQAKRLFTVLGQVQRPGTYRFPDREALNLIQVIGIAGGYTRLADPARITVKRQVEGRETVFRVDGKRMAREGGSEPFVVRAGDMITVSERLF
jgi:polysaccharide export outer membrane protein